MVEGLYSEGRIGLLGGNIDLANSPVSAVLVDSSLYTPDLENDLSIADIPEAALIAEVLLTGKALSRVDVAGDPSVVFRADNALFSSLSVAAGVTVGGVVLFFDQETASASTLILFTDNSPDLPATPDGTDFTLRWDSGDNGIFRWPSTSI